MMERITQPLREFFAYLGPALMLKDSTVEEKRRLRKLHLVESVSTLTIAAFVNVAILVAAAAAFYPSTVTSRL